MRFENIQLLLKELEEILRLNRFAWIDKQGLMVCDQKGVFRVNCVDCLDRSNVVQASLAQMVLEFQLRKFGLLSPEESLPLSVLMKHKEIWANNGDSISRQYAGTAALKGDFTRTGQRQLAGLMRDGYSSATRYYNGIVRDARRQRAIDQFLGKEEEATLMALEPAQKNEFWIDQKDEQLRVLVQETQAMIVPEDEIILGAWALVNAEDGNAVANEIDDMDTLVDKVVNYESIPLASLTRVEAGPLQLQRQLGSFLKSRAVGAVCIRTWYRPGGLGLLASSGGPIPPNVSARSPIPAKNPASSNIPTSKNIQERNPDNPERFCEEEDSQLERPTVKQPETFKMWTSGSTRLFNNMAIAIKSPEDAAEYVYAILEQFTIALTCANCETVPAVRVTSLPRAQKPKMRQSLGQVGRRTSLLTFSSTLSTSIQRGVARASTGLGLTRKRAVPGPLSSPRRGARMLTSKVGHTPKCGTVISCAKLNERDPEMVKIFGRSNVVNSSPDPGLNSTSRRYNSIPVLLTSIRELVPRFAVGKDGASCGNSNEQIQGSRKPEIVYDLAANPPDSQGGSAPPWKRVASPNLNLPDCGLKSSHSEGYLGLKNAGTLPNSGTNQPGSLPKADSFVAKLAQSGLGSAWNKLTAGGSHGGSRQKLSEPAVLSTTVKEKYGERVKGCKNAKFILM